MHLSLQGNENEVLRGGIRPLYYMPLHGSQKKKRDRTVDRRGINEMDRLGFSKQRHSKDESPQFE